MIGYEMDEWSKVIIGFVIAYLCVAGWSLLDDWRKKK